MMKYFAKTKITETIPKTMAVIPALRVIGRSGLMTATATALQAATDG